MIPYPPQQEAPNLFATSDASVRFTQRVEINEEFRNSFKSISPLIALEYLKYVLGLGKGLFTDAYKYNILRRHERVSIIRIFSYTATSDTDILKTRNLICSNPGHHGE